MTQLIVQVKPNAKQPKLLQREDGTWVIHLKAPPTDGKANQELIARLAQHFGVTKAQVAIKSGHTSRLRGCLKRQRVSYVIPVKSAMATPEPLISRLSSRKLHLKQPFSNNLLSALKLMIEINQSWQL